MRADITTAVRILNEAFAADPSAISQLFDICVSCNTDLVYHPTIQVAGSDAAPHVRFIGLLNGVLEPMTGQRVAARYDETGLIGFQVYNPS